MRPWIILFSCVGFCSGCTHVALERRAVKQASTITDLQYQQVLDNLAMFASNKDALPWHVNLKGGTVQLTDQASAAFMATIPSAVSDSVKALFTPSLAGQRAVVNQWDVDPVTDTDALESLEYAYMKAIDPADINGKIRQNILSKICDLSVRFDLLPQDDTIRAIFTETENGAKGKETLERIVLGLHYEIKAAEDRKGAIQKYIGEAQTGSDKAGLDKEKRELIDSIGFKKAQIEAMRDLMLPELKDSKAIKCQIEKTKETLEKTKPEVEKRRLQLQKEYLESILSYEEEKDGGKKERGKKEGMPQSINAPKKHALPRGQSRSDRGPRDESDTILRILTAIHDACAPGYLPHTDLKWETERNPALIDQAEDKIRRLEELLKEDSKFRKPWISVATSKKDVPKCACYVGHYHGCKGDWYVWVMPDKLDVLREFTLSILDLAAPSEPEIPRFTSPVFSPALR